MKIPKRKKDYYIPVMFLISVLLTAICFMAHSSGTSSVLSSGLSFIVSPLKSATRAVYSVCSDIGTYFENVKALKDENERLKEENERLSEENKHVDRYKGENEVLYKFLDLKKERTDFNLTNTNIISRANSNYISTFTIDKGSFHGIKENMPVIAEGGVLIGITYSVEPNSTRCRSLLSYDVKVGVYDEQSGETGILSGSFDTFKDNKYVLEGLSDTTTVREGDKILTSGLGEIYPRGLIIGEVEGFISDFGSHTKNAVILPDSKAFSGDRVMVITSFERVYE